MVTFGNKIIGDGNPCFITFEAGPTHQGFESAKRLIKLAADAGADAIKFQIIDPNRLLSDKSLTVSYKILINRESDESKTVEENLYDILCHRTLNREEWVELKKYSDTVGLSFFATVGFSDEIEFLEELQCDSIKIASADISHLPLIRKAARTGMCLQLDTGNASMGEIETAVDTIIGEGNQNIIIHQCPSGYPPRLESINLNIIPTLKRMFPFPVAFSDHTPGWDMDIAALAIGANLVEKTITEDRSTNSIEHIFSLEPNQMNRFVDKIREMEIALGNTRRVFTNEERNIKKRGRRSMYLKSNVQMGDSIKDVEIEYSRPGFGIEPNYYEQIKDLQFLKDFPAGHMLLLSDIG